MDFSQAKILVVGDVMLDQYWSGQAGRISPEAPVPVVKVADEDLRAGGAANVALNAVALGAKVHLLGVVGSNNRSQTGSEEALDLYGQQLSGLMDLKGVSYDWVTDACGTICKLRVLSHHQQLIRMDFENPIPLKAAEKLADRVAEKIAEFDLLVISDYAKGSLQSVQRMIAAAKSVGVPVFVDPKGLDFSLYAGATLIKPNQSEFEAIMGVCPSDETLIESGHQMIEQLDIKSLLVTRSEHGMALISDGKADLLQSQAQEVFDVTGAGDTVIATLACAYAAGENLKHAMQLANHAAGIVIRKVGTSVVTQAELDETIKQSMRHQGYVAPDEDRLLELVQLAQKNGEKVVFTNGCFDLLHSGHVRYLNEAAQYGERLIVAVNSDESVKILKGQSRPIVPLESRMELLSALSCVDWVVAFSEETPERLICKLGPDVLVKGGDYQPEEIAGSKCVWEKGGEVKVLSFWDGYSTTSMVEKINQ